MTALAVRGRYINRFYITRVNCDQLSDSNDVSTNKLSQFDCRTLIRAASINASNDSSKKTKNIIDAR